MHLRIRLAAALLALCPPAAAAELPQSFTALSYATEVAGLTVMITEADVEMTARGYRVDIATRTAGTYGLLFRGETRTLARGYWAGAMIVPERYAVEGFWRGTPRRTLMDYVMGQPTVLRLDPPNESEREPVPDALQRETIDTISAATLLVRQATLGSACDGSTRTYDGRRLFEVSSRTGGWERFAPGDVQGFAGPALRCEFDGQMLAGFMLEGDRAAAARPQKGIAWLARLSPDGPMLPVRIKFELRWVGSATMDLRTAQPGGTPLVRRRADAELAPVRP